jgi:hypothetical protein
MSGRHANPSLSKETTIANAAICEFASNPDKVRRYGTIPAAASTRKQL